MYALEILEFLETEAKRNKNGYRGVSRGICKSSAGLELKNNPS
jgi:hypothetical protein